MKTIKLKLLLLYCILLFIMRMPDLPAASIEIFDDNKEIVSWMEVYNERIASFLLVDYNMERETGESGEQSDSIWSEQEVRRYVNPLPLESYPVRSSRSSDRFDKIDVADPVVVRHDGYYYLFATGGMAWVSSDLVNWKYHPVTLPEGKRVVAPHIAEYKGNFYMCGNTQDLFRSPHPLGPWELIGQFKNENGKTFRLFDAMMFVDDDDRVYMFFSGGSTKGIYGVELDQNDLTKFKSAPTHFFRFEPSHKWERYGDLNEYTKVSWIEAPWMTKHNGTYYMQYSAPGTQWKTYAVGVYTGSSPLGPFTYYPGSPILVHNKGLINGIGHHCVIDAPDGTLWAFFNILYQNWPDRSWERRIGMDPVEIDEDGNMIIHGPTEIPQWGPGLKTQALDDAIGGVIPVSINKTRYSVSSEAPGRDAQYAFDNYIRTWWEADANDLQPSLMIDLGYGNFDEMFIINSSRIIFTTNKLKRSEDIVTGPYQYKIEVSSDGETFKIALDKTKNNVTKNVEFDEIDPVKCRYVRLTITGAPPKVPVGIIEFTVFGNPVEP